MMVQQGKQYIWLSIRLCLLLMVFLISVQWMVLSFRVLNRSIIEQIIIATSNPFASLFIGLLVTALIQSSSTTTTMIVAMVASNTTTMESAVFMVMGANIGTTVTSTFVSLGHVTRRREFRKAIAAATVHDFFNILTATILLPLEYYFGLLSRSALALASLLVTQQNSLTLPVGFNPMSLFFVPVANFLQSLVGGFAWIGVLIAISLVFASIHYIGLLFKDWFTAPSDSSLEHKFFSSPLRSLLIGTFFTAFVQSSSLVSSLVVPIVASNRLSIKKAFPFIMGANVGTTITALLASFAESEAAIGIALAHFLFNFFGVMIFFPLAYLRNLPVRLARHLGKATLKNRAFGFAYVMIVFFLVPFLLIFFSKGKVLIRHYDYYQEQQVRIQNTSKGKQNPVTLLYKVSNYDNTSKNLSLETQQVKVEQSGDTLFMNQQFFLNVSQKDCWQGTDREGKYQTCLLSIQSPYQISSTARADTAHIYLKRYLYSANKNTYKLFLDLNQRIVLKQELWNQDGKLVSREELISILE